MRDELKQHVHTRAPDYSWLAELKLSELQLLRQVVRKVHMQYHPESLQTDSEADKIIASFGPETAEKMLKAAIDRKLA